MRKYNEPEIKFVSFDIEDGIMESSPSPSPFGNGELIVSRANAVPNTADVENNYFTDYKADDEDWGWTDMP